MCLRTYKYSARGRGSVEFAPSAKKIELSIDIIKTVTYILYVLPRGHGIPELRQREIFKCTVSPVAAFISSSERGNSEPRDVSCRAHGPVCLLMQRNVMPR